MGLEGFGTKIKLKRVRQIGVFIKESFRMILRKELGRRFILMEINL
jgi:hypothetical protein